MDSWEWVGRVADIAQILGLALAAVALWYARGQLVSAREQVNDLRLEQKRVADELSRRPSFQHWFRDGRIETATLVRKLGDLTLDSDQHLRRLTVTVMARNVGTRSAASAMTNVRVSDGVLVRDVERPASKHAMVPQLVFLHHEAMQHPRTTVDVTSTVEVPDATARYSIIAVTVHEFGQDRTELTLELIK
jgi:hypothetical protein